MPRVVNGRNRHSTAKAILLKPYDRPGTHTLDHQASDTTIIDPGQVESREEVKAAKKGEYNKTHLVALIVKASTSDWEKLSKAINKTPTHTWRKTISPALLAGKVWSNSGPGWDGGMKIKAVLEVVGSSRPDWAVLGNIMGGKTASQVKDIWRKVILPRLKKGMTIE